MARRRGFFAELNYQAQQAEKRRRQQQAAAVRAQVAAAREAERAHRAADRARAAAARASEAQRRAAVKEVARLHVEARLAEVATMNATLANALSEIDGLLAWTLEFDDFVDLESLKITTVDHPEFDPGKLGQSAPPLPDLVYPPEPVYQEPPAPKGFSAVVGGKRKHQEVIQRARAEHEEAHRRWHRQATGMHANYLAHQEQREKAEAERMAKLAEAEAAYHADCRRREAEADARNEELAKLINDLAFDVESAIQEYVGIVLSNSVYPDAFPVQHEYEFDLSSRELTLAATVPDPSSLPSVKEYRYVKAKDEIAATSLPVKAQKDRYAGAVWQVAVRTLHEVFEADRAGKIHSISLTVGVNRVSPATGRPETVPLVVVAADRRTFNGFDLAKVVAKSTLTHLGAAMAKSPFDLTPVDASRGVRVRGQS